METTKWAASAIGLMAVALTIKAIEWANGQRIALAHWADGNQGKSYVMLIAFGVVVGAVGMYLGDHPATAKRVGRGFKTARQGLARLSPKSRKRAAA